MTPVEIFLNVMGEVLRAAQVMIAHVQWPLVYKIARVVFIILDCAALWFIVVYVRRALAYRPIIDTRALPPDIAEILKRAEVRKKFEERWRALRKGAAATPPGSYRDAIVGADALIDALLVEAGFTGRDAAERFGKLNRLGLRRRVLNDLFAAHRVRNRVAHDAAFAPDAQSAERVLDQYGRFLIEVKIITS